MTIVYMLGISRTKGISIWSVTGRGIIGVRKKSSWVRLG